MATNETKSGTGTIGKAGEGTNTTTSSTAAGIVGNTAGSGQVVAPPTDAQPGEVQGGSIGVSDAQAQAKTNDKKAEENAGYALRITVDNHQHNGADVKKGQTILVDIATYRWALENKKGEPGNKDDAGFDVTKKGEVIKPETDEDAVARLEQEYAAK